MFEEEVVNRLENQNAWYDNWEIDDVDTIFTLFDLDAGVWIVRIRGTTQSSKRNRKKILQWIHVYYRVP